MPPKKEPEENSTTRRRPATTPDDREKQMINYADALAEKQLREGTASSQVIIHYLKLGTSRERHEQEKIVNENLRIRAQISQLESQGKTEEMMEKVYNAIKLYAGVDEEDDI